MHANAVKTKHHIPIKYPNESFLTNLYPTLSFFTPTFFNAIKAKNTHKYRIGITIEFKFNNQLNNPLISFIPSAGTIINILTRTKVNN